MSEISPDFEVSVTLENGLTSDDYRLSYSSGYVFVRSVLPASMVEGYVKLPDYVSINLVTKSVRNGKVVFTIPKQI